ncbi:MAG: glycosyltransferase family 39 protein [archaeon]
MKPTERLRNDALIIAGFSLFVALLLTLGYGYYEQSDTAGYIKAANIMVNGSIEQVRLWDHEEHHEDKSRFLRPMQSLLISLYPPLMKDIFHISNILFVLGTSILVYLVCLRLGFGRHVGLISAIIYNSSLVVLHFDYSLLADAGTHFFYALTVYLTLDYAGRYPGSLARPVLISVLCGTATLMKENAGMGIVLLFLVILFDRGRLRLTGLKNRALDKLAVLIVISAGFLIPYAINQVINTVLFDYNLFQWLAHDFATSDVKSQFTILRFIVAYISAFSILLPPCLYAYYRIMRGGTYNKKVLFTALLISGVVSTFMWKVLLDRYAFLAFLFAIPLGVDGMGQWIGRFRHKKWMWAIFIGTYLALNAAALILYRNPAAYALVNRFIFG